MADTPNGVHWNVRENRYVTWAPNAVVAGRLRWGILPLWTLATPVLLVGVACHVRFLRLRAARRVGLCPACGYDLRATPGRCPECGRAAAVPN